MKKYSKSFLGLAAAAFVLGLMASPMPASAGGSYHGHYGFSDESLVRDFAGDSFQFIVNDGDVVATSENWGDVGGDVDTMAVGNFFQRDGRSSCTGPCSDVPTQFMFGEVDAISNNHAYGMVDGDINTAAFGNWVDGSKLKLSTQIVTGDVTATTNNWGTVTGSISTISVGNAVTASPMDQ